MFRSLVLLLAVMLCFSINLMAQCDRILGIVLDEHTGEGLPGANVHSYNNSALGTTTDTSGKFELRLDKADSIVISFIGYRDKVIQITQECELIIHLTSSETNLNEVVIQVEKLIAEEFIIKKINKLEIYTNPSAKADPLLAVNSTPSATTTDESANISLRGSSPAETGIFLNNVPINGAVRYSQLNGIGTFSIFNTALISQVQVYPGNPPLEFGNTTSGAIALYTEDALPEKNSNTVSTTLSSYGFYTQRKLTKNSSLTAFSNYQPSEAIKWVNQKALDRLKKFTSLDLGLHYFLKVSTRTSFKIFNYSNTESFRYQMFEPTYTGIFTQDKMRNYTVTNLRHRFKNAELSWNSGLSFSRAHYLLSTLDSHLKLRDVFSSLNYQYFGDQYEFKTGFSYDYRGSDFHGNFPSYEFAMGEQFPIDSLTLHQSVKVPEVYLYFKYYLSPKWVAGIGFRKNIPISDQSDFLSSQFNLNFKPSSYWNIVWSAGRYNKLVLIQGNEFTSGHIQTDQFSTDLNYKKGKIESSVSLFHKRGKQSETATKISGLELYGRYKFNDQFRTQLSLTSLNAKQTSKGETQSSPYDIHYFLRGNVEYRFGGTWTATIIFLFRQGSFYKPVISATYHSIGAYEPQYGDPERLPSYNMIDASVSKLMNWGKNVSSVAFCGISNLPNFKNVRDYSYNFDYQERSANYFSLRTVYFGCIVNF